MLHFCMYLDYLYQSTNLTSQYFTVLNKGAQLNCGIEAIQKTQRFFACNCTEKHNMLQLSPNQIYLQLKSL